MRKARSEGIPNPDGSTLSVFVPDPDRCVPLTIPAGGSITWTIPADTLLFDIQPTAQVEMRFNAQAFGPKFDAKTDGPYGVEGIHPDTSSITFVGTEGTVIIVRAE
jgi:hypothetical protein